MDEDARRLINLADALRAPPGRHQRGLKRPRAERLLNY